MLGNIEEQWHLHHREKIYICYIESHIHDFPFNIKQPKQLKWEEITTPCTVFLKGKQKCINYKNTWGTNIPYNSSFFFSRLIADKESGRQIKLITPYIACTALTLCRTFLFLHFIFLWLGWGNRRWRALYSHLCSEVVDALLQLIYAASHLIEWVAVKET